MLFFLLLLWNLYNGQLLKFVRFLWYSILVSSIWHNFKKILSIYWSLIVPVWYFLWLCIRLCHLRTICVWFESCSWLLVESHLCRVNRQLLIECALAARQLQCFSSEFELKGIACTKNPKTYFFSIYYFR